MAHVRSAGLDFVVAAFIVHPIEPKVCLVHHKKVSTWLAPGGHIGDENPYENSDQALIREVYEETGL